MAQTIVRPRVFLDIQIGTAPAGRIVIELFNDKAPRTCEKYVYFAVFLETIRNSDIVSKSFLLLRIKSDR